MSFPSPAIPKTANIDPLKKQAIKYLFTLIAILLLCPLRMMGQEKRDSVVVSLITCWPGSEVYELCGHEALRVRGISDGIPVDTVWNYGVFNFNEPNFVYRFVKGETDYLLAGYPFEWFLPEYIESGRKVIEQDLNLTPEETAQLVAMLREEGRPENRTYRYNYVRDNCATRILDRIDSVAGAPVVYPDNVKYGTFRKEMRHYHQNYPWYQFGIDIALGSGIDIPITGKEEMFVPIEMADKAEGAHFADGRPLVRQSRVLYEGTDSAVLPATPWYLTPVAIGWLLFAIASGFVIWMWVRKDIIKTIYSVWFGLTGLAGSLVAFLVFISKHEATDPNVLLLWLNPFQLIFAISIWSRRARVLSYIMAYYNIISLGCLLIVWQAQRQSANPAFFPLMGISIILAVAFAVLAPDYYQFNKKGETALNNKGPHLRFSRREGSRSNSQINKRKKVK